MKYSKLAKLLLLAIIIVLSSSCVEAWAGVQFEDGTLSGASNGKYDDTGEVPQITFYYLAGYSGEVVAGIKITPDETEDVTIAFEVDSGVKIIGAGDDRDVTNENIPIQKTGLSHLFKVKVLHANEFGTGKTLKIKQIKNGNEELLTTIALIGQPVTVEIVDENDSFYASYGVNHGTSFLSNVHYITSNVNLFWEPFKLYKMDYLGTGMVTTEEFHPESFIIPNVGTTGGIKISAINTDTFTLASEGEIVVDGEHCINNVAFLGVVAPQGLRIENLSGPKVAGYDGTTTIIQFDIHREHLLSLKDSDSKEATVSATVGGSVAFSSFEVVLEPTITDENVKFIPQFQNIEIYDGGEAYAGNPTTTKTFNGLTLAYDDINKKITVTGTATSPGTQKFGFLLTVNTEEGKIIAAGSFLYLTVAISPYSGGQAPEQDVIPGDPPAQNETVKPKPEETVVDDVKTKITDDLALENVTVVGADTTKVKTGISVFAGTESIREFTTYAVSVNQPVKEGGAVVLATDLSILTNKTLTGVEQEKAKDLDDLTSKYSLNKYFAGTTGDFASGNAVDLLQAYKGQSGLFTYSEDGTLKLNAIVVVIDDKVPAGETDVKSPLNNSAVGVKLAQHSDGGNYLYIFDGNKDGNASDPIMFVQKETSEAPAEETPDEEIPDEEVPDESDPVETDPEESDPVVVPVNPGKPSQSSGGGCNAGYGMIGLLLVGIALRKYLTL
jgi:hypothetical protein